MENWLTLRKVSQNIENGSHVTKWVTHKKVSHLVKNGSPLKSKDTYGQTRGLSNLEMKYVGKLAIIGALFKAKQA